MHYKMYNIDAKYLRKFEAEISEADTLLEVFAIMKAMYDKLMHNMEKITKWVSQGLTKEYTRLQ
jgi:hypothetical protein